MSNEGKRPRGRPPTGRTNKSTTVRLPFDLLDKAKRVVDYTPNSFTDLVIKGLEHQIEEEHRLYEKEHGQKMPGGD